VKRSPSESHHSPSEHKTSSEKVKRSPSKPHHSASEHETSGLKQERSHLKQKHSHLKQEHSYLEREKPRLGDRCYCSEDRRSRKTAKLLRQATVFG
jgi:predicted RNase H-like nuclease (RuvC/YqgF family)